MAALIYKPQINDEFRYSFNNGDWSNIYRRIDPNNYIDDYNEDELWVIDSQGKLELLHEIHEIEHKYSYQKL